MTDVAFFPTAYSEASSDAGPSSLSLSSSSSGRGGLVSSLDPLSNVSFEDEPPLLDELGIYPAHIWGRTKRVLNPLSRALDESFLEDRDVAGPLVFCLLLGACLLMTGKLYMGYVLGMGLSGSLGVFMLLHLMTEHTLDSYQVISVLGYCMLPVVALAALAVVVDLHGSAGAVAGLVAVLWSTKSATSIFEDALQMAQQRYLIAYPVFLFYTTFVLVSIFR